MQSQNFGYLWRREGIRGGRPCLDGTGVPVDALVDRFVAGESLAELAEDYRLSLPRVEAAVRLVLYARGTNLDEKRAAEKVDRVIPLLAAGVK